MVLVFTRIRYEYDRPRARLQTAGSNRFLVKMEPKFEFRTFWGHF